MSNKQKVLLLQEKIMPYRIPIYQLIAQHVDLTVACAQNQAPVPNVDFHVLNLKKYTLGPLVLTPSVVSICKNYDVVISLAHLRIPFFQIITILPHKYKLLFWSIGNRASYNRPFSTVPERNMGFYILKKLFSFADAIIFYTQVPIAMWKSLGIEEEKCFVAQNTVAIEKMPKVKDEQRNSILFVGTLYKQKKIDELIEAYTEASSCFDDFPTLSIVGDGDEMPHLQELSKTYPIELHGAIFDEKKLSQLFAKAIVCVSPGQAGLSVLKSMGYGVPYVTRDTAITGGEISNITNDVNGIIYKTQEELVDILKKVKTEPEYFRKLGENAQKYYETYATPENMANGVLKAIEYATRHKE